jgi:hypothetical protein
MAIVTIPGAGLWLPTPYPANGAGPPTHSSLATLTTAAGRIAVAIFQVPKTGTLDWFEWRSGTVSNQPDNGLRLSFQDVDANGSPDNGEDQYIVSPQPFSANAWQVPAAYMGSTGGGSGSKRSVTQGDWLACVIRFESFVASDSISITALTSSSNVGTPSPQYKFTSTSTDSGASYVKQTDRNICIALKYNDGTYGYLGWPDIPALTFNTRTYASNTAGADERGLLFQVPVPCRLIGAWVRLDSDAAVDVVLYDAANGVVTSQTYGLKRLATTGLNGRIYFPISPTLTENVNYRLIVKPTTTSSISMYDFDINSSGLLATMDGGPTWMSTDRVDAGAWNNVNTNRPLMGLIFDGFDSGGSSGGGETSAVF